MRVNSLQKIKSQTKRIWIHDCSRDPWIQNSAKEAQIKYTRSASNTNTISDKDCRALTKKEPFIKLEKYPEFICMEKLKIYKIDDGKVVVWTCG